MSKSIGYLATCALRYALPRHTYITSVVCDSIIENLANIPPEDVIRMVVDIDKQLEYDTSMYQCDRDVFIKLRDVLAPPKLRYEGGGYYEGC